VAEQADVSRRLAGIGPADPGQNAVAQDGQAKEQEEGAALSGGHAVTLTPRRRASIIPVTRTGPGYCRAR
jgi:hypothetical protein